MRRYEYDKDRCDGWKSYPVRFTLDRLSGCCRKPLVLVQSMEGGFVTANCFKYGQRNTVSDGEFISLLLLVSCPKCKAIMPPKIIEKNYSYVCEDCQLYVRFADLLPHWQEL